LFPLLAVSCRLLAARCWLSAMDKIMEHHAQVPVQCPVCSWRHFLEVETEVWDLATGSEVRKHLEAWIASRCPDHLGPILEMSKN